MTTSRRDFLHRSLAGGIVALIPKTLLLASEPKNSEDHVMILQNLHNVDVTTLIIDRQYPTRVDTPGWIPVLEMNIPKEDIKDGQVEVHLPYGWNYNSKHIRMVVKQVTTGVVEGLNVGGNPIMVGVSLSQEVEADGSKKKRPPTDAEQVTTMLTERYETKEGNVVVRSYNLDAKTEKTSD